MIFQDPQSSLNPRKTIGSIIGEPFAIHGLMKRVHHGLIGGVDADEHGNAEHNSGDSQQPARQVLPDVRPANEFQQDHGSVRLSLRT